MRKSLSQLLPKIAVVLLFFLGPINAIAANIDKMIIFGDSLSDTGNLYYITSQVHQAAPASPVIPRSPPYYDGHFTNGYNWAEALALKLNLRLDGGTEPTAQFANFAYGGAWVESMDVSKQIFPFELAAQVDFFLETNILDPHPENHLYVIWAGANDYLSGREDAEDATTKTVAAIQHEIEKLLYFGARYILVLNLPDLGTLPDARAAGAVIAGKLTNLSQMHNDKLAAMIEQEQTANVHTKILTIDVGTYFNDLLHNPGAYGLTNVTEPCYQGGLVSQNETRQIMDTETIANRIISNNLLFARMSKRTTRNLQDSVCEDPDQYLFWDLVHPTHHVHEILSEKILAVMQQNDLQGASTN